MEESPQNWLKAIIHDRFLGSTQSDEDTYQVFVDQISLKANELERLDRQIQALWRSEFPQYDLEILFRSRATPIKSRQPIANGLGVMIKRRAIPGVHKILVVASGKGGVGKSTVAANIAVSLGQMGLRVGLLDADLYGPSAPLLLGNDNQLQVSEQQKLIPVEAHGIKMVSFGNLTPADTPVIWRGPLISKAFEQFCYDVAWGELDYLVLDLPPGTGDIQLTLVEKLPIAGAVIVSTPQDIALIDVTKGISMFRQLDVPILGLVENMALHTCTNCGHQEHIFGDQLNRFAADQNISVLAKIPLTAELRLRSDRGQPMGRSHFAFATLVDTIVARLTP